MTGWLTADNVRTCRRSIKLRLALSTPRDVREKDSRKNCWMSSGDFRPAAAQLSRYHVSHCRRLIFQYASVAGSENVAAASRPLHNEPEP